MTPPQCNLQEALKEYHAVRNAHQSLKVQLEEAMNSKEFCLQKKCNDLRKRDFLSHCVASLHEVQADLQEEVESLHRKDTWVRQVWSLMLLVLTLVLVPSPISAVTDVHTQTKMDH